MSVLLANSNSKRMPIADKVVQCAVLSPPYWNLRVYSGTASWSGGSSDCDHEAARKKTRFDYPLDEKQASNGGSDLCIYGDNCPDCGAVRVDHQLGSEETHDCLAWAKGEPPCRRCFVCNLREVFAELWRVLRDDGTVWLNLGDSYAASGVRQTGRNDNGRISSDAGKGWAEYDITRETRKTETPGLKSKDLCLIPARVALALQADGWWVRSEIIWHKLNPMPGSQRDRPTTSHEQIYLLSKKERYFYDAEAVKEAQSETTLDRFKNGGNRLQGKKFKSTGDDNVYAGNVEYSQAILEGGRTLRDVWSLASESFSGAHYAVFPTEIPRRCIKAGSPEAGSCSVCGAPWERIVEREPADMQARYERGEPTRHGKNGAKASGVSRVGDFSAKTTVSGHRPTCNCNAPARPAIILDPFAGSGTSVQVARELGRHGIGLDLSYTYLHDVARARLNLDKLEAWQNNTSKPESSADLSELPLFGSLKD